MTVYQWADGFHPPKGVSADQVKTALDKLKEPSPERLLDASKRQSHCLHNEFWSEGDQVWAQRGRLERSRKIIGAVKETVYVGGREIEIRAVEFVRTDPDRGGALGRWATLEAIAKDDDLRDAFMSELVRLQLQAAGKIERLQAFMRERSA